MSRIAYVNGRYVPHGRAMVHIEDRGYQFADGVYEVCEVRGGHLVDETRHMQRLARSLGELRITPPMAQSAIGVVLREVVRRNRVGEGIVYAQVTRGVAARDHAFPERSLRSSLVVTAKELPVAPRRRRAEHGVAVITVPDNRWERVDIKTIALLPNVLAKQAAHDAGAFEAWFVDGGGFVTEGSSTNAWIVNADGILVSRQADRSILRGITRSVVLDIVGRESLRVEERPFSLSEALAAREAFLTSASTAVTPIVTINGTAVGNGKPGPVAKHLRQIFDQAVEIAPLWASGERR